MVAWLAASGVSADLLQVFAYANMAAANAKTMTASAAVAKAMEDAPCAMCKVAASARQAAEQAPLGKQEVAHSKVKPDGAVCPSACLPATWVARNLFVRSPSRSSVRS